jgi:dTMP kinase
MNGYMLVVDGVNGAGKSSAIKGLNEYFSSRGMDVVLTQEPGATALGQRLRKMIKEDEFPEIFNESKLLLFCAARAQNLREIIQPALSAGKFCISDRWEGSSRSFQGAAEGMPISVVKDANKVALGSFIPDLTVILDIDPSAGIHRSQVRGGEVDYFEKQGVEYHCRARQEYLNQAMEEPLRFLVIDASLPASVVLEKIITEVERRLAERENHGQAKKDRKLMSA